MKNITLGELLYLVLSQITRDYLTNPDDYHAYRCRLNSNQLYWHKQIHEASKQCPNLAPLNQVVFQTIHHAMGTIVFSEEVYIACTALTTAQLLMWQQSTQNQFDCFIFSWRGENSDWLDQRKAEIFAGNSKAAWQFEGLVFSLARKLMV